MNVAAATTHWEAALVQHFGSKAVRYLPAVVANILAVGCGLKPAYLWDAFASPAGPVRLFVDHLKGRGLLESHLDVVVVGEDVFVVSLAQTVNTLRRLVDGSSLPLVDVSKVHGSPQLADDGNAALVKGHLLGVLAQLYPPLRDGQLHRANSNSHTELIELQLGAQWNLTTLYGALLRYPVMYWYDASVETASDSCLAMSPLRVYDVSAAPSPLHDRGPAATADSWSIHSIYSFSVPESLHGHFRARIEAWFADLSATFELQEVFKDLRLKSHTVTLPSVAL